MARKSFNTPMDEDLANQLRRICKERDIQITDVITALVTAYVNGDIDFQKKTTYEIRRTDI
ncbi:MAG: hypothetical protein RR710_04205 [Oscillospiraceae bacterium]